MVSAQASSEVNAIICGSGSSVTITSPASDSVVAEPTTILKGSIGQSSQIEVRVDGGFDSIISIDTTQLTYEAPVHLTTGTHTVTLKAIDSCGAADSEISIVLTYAPAPSTPSSGTNTQTTTDGVTIGSPQEGTVETGSRGLLPTPVVETWESILKWLNISSADISSSSSPKLSLLRALTIAVGTYLATIGLAVTAVNILASALPFKKNVPMKVRTQRIMRVSRIGGVLLLLAGFFL